MTNKTYVKLLLTLLLSIFGSTFIYIYYYTKNYPTPLFHRISLDAKMMFIRDMPNRNNIDTIIIGSSIGLNNIQGIILEKESQKVKYVLNLSSFSMEVTHIEQIWSLMTLFPNLKRVIYSAQSLDFTSSSTFGKYNFNFIKDYLNLGYKNTNVKYSFYAYKNFIQCIERRWNWKKQHLAHNSFSNIDFDRTGSAPLHIYGSDIIQKRWTNPYVVKTNKKSYEALAHIIQKAKEKHITFYFIAQPYRLELVQNDKHLHNILEEFHRKTKKVVTENGAYYLNLHKKLHLADKYFADRIHLNDKGSIITTHEIAHYIDTNE